MRIIILSAALILLSSCLCSYPGRSREKALDSPLNFEFKDLGLVHAYSYSYKGKTNLYILHGRKLKHLVKVDTIRTVKNPSEVNIYNPYK